MTDEREPGAPEVPSTGSDTGSPEAVPKKKNMVWIWIAVAVAVLALVGVAYTASQESGGGGLFLLFHGGGVSVPQVIGLTQQEAETAIVQATLTVGAVSDSPTLAVAPGIVVAQAPDASTNVDTNSSVDISISVIPAASVPDVVGKTESDASGVLAEQGLLLGTVSYVNDSKVKAGYVKSQQPAAGTETKVGTSVALTVSKGPETGQVPSVVGLPENDAQSTLEGAGFKVTTTQATSADVPAGDVMSQSPVGGTVVNTGSNVTITVSKGAPAAPKVTVPNVVGMGVLDALTALQDVDLKFSIEFTQVTEGFLKVASQDPKSGAQVNPGTSVTISVGLPGFLLGGGIETPSEPATETPTATPLPSEPTTGQESAPTTP